MPLTYDDIVVRVGRLMMSMWEIDKMGVDEKARADKSDAELTELKKQMEMKKQQENTDGVV